MKTIMEIKILDKMEVKKNKRILLEDKESDWLQIWTTASLLYKKKKTLFFSLIGCFSKICHIKTR